MSALRSLAVSTVMVASLLVPLSAGAAKPTAPPAKIPEPGRRQVALAPAARLPMHRELLAALEAERTQVEALSARALAAPPIERAALQRQIEAVKQEGQVTLFEIQLRYARQEGRVVQAQQLERAIQALTNPPEAREVLKSTPRAGQ